MSKFYNTSFLIISCLWAPFIMGILLVIYALVMIPAKLFIYTGIIFEALAQEAMATIATFINGVKEQVRELEEPQND